MYRDKDGKLQAILLIRLYTAVILKVSMVEASISYDYPITFERVLGEEKRTIGRWYRRRQPTKGHYWISWKLEGRGRRERGEGGPVREEGVGLLRASRSAIALLRDSNIGEETDRKFRQPFSVGKRSPRRWNFIERRKQQDHLPVITSLSFRSRYFVNELRCSRTIELSRRRITYRLEAGPRGCSNESNVTF